MKYRVLFHLNDGLPEKQGQALTNIENLLRDIPDVRVELVVQGAALPLAVAASTRFGEALAALQERGVTVAVCRNSMKAMNVREEELVPGAEVISSAVGELVRRQQEGWAYVKP